MLSARPCVKPVSARLLPVQTRCWSLRGQDEGSSPARLVFAVSTALPHLRSDTRSQAQCLGQEPVPGAIMVRRRSVEDDTSSEEEEEEEVSSSDEEDEDSDFSPLEATTRKGKKITKAAPELSIARSHTAATLTSSASKKKSPSQSRSLGKKEGKRGGGHGTVPRKSAAARTGTTSPGTLAGRKRRKLEREEDDEEEGKEEDEAKEVYDEDEEEDDDDEPEGKRRGGSTRRRTGKNPRKTKGLNVTGVGNSKVDKVLEEVRQLMLRSRRDDAPNPTLADLGITTVREVSDMAPEGVLFEIEKTILAAAGMILRGEGFSYQVPTRSATNQLYIAELDRIVLSDKVATRAFLNPREVRKTAITTRIMQLVHEVLSKGIHITKRDMFYTDVKLFRDQKDSDVVLDDVACMLGCTRSCLNVVASEKGLVVGRVQFEEDGDFIDCTRMGVGGKAIPPYVDKIARIQSDAKFILLVEKEAAYMRLAEDRFYNKYPCIVITAKGQPDVATRLFLKKLKTELHIPVLGLVDSDPYGLKILSVYMTGSKNMSYDSASLTTSDIKWLGVRPSDLDKYGIPPQCRLDMTDHDMRTGRQLLQEDFIQKNPEWVKELQLMLKMKKKAEIQALSAFGFQYITEDYLPRKLEKGDWI